MILQQGKCSFSQEMKTLSPVQDPGQMLQGSVFISGWAGYSVLFPVFSRHCGFILPLIDCSKYLEPIISRSWKTIFAWSLGAHLCLKNLDRLRADRLILIAPFLDFCQGTPRDRIEEMLRGLDKNPQATVRWFWKACAVKQPPAPVISDPGILRNGLEFLIHSRVTQESLNTDLPVTIIHGLKDRIVPPEQSKLIKHHLTQAWYQYLPFGHYIPELEILNAVH